MHGLSAHQANILIFLDAHRGVPLREWPRPLRVGSSIASLKRRALIVQRARSPRRLTLTGRGADLALWVSALKPATMSSPATKRKNGSE
jgi:hypothetical protein